jgi:chemotaxis protein methyltransferase CheR
LFGKKWNLPQLRQLLEAVAAGETEAVHEAFEHEPILGEGATLFSARRIAWSGGPGATIVLSITDICDHRAQERNRQALLDHAEELLRQQSIILREMEHRVANSLQIIASILMLKAKAVSSDETREHLKDAQRRVLSVAEVQKHLHPAGGFDRTEVSSYLEKLCAGLARSMVRDATKTKVKVIAEEKSLLPLRR